MTIEPTPSLLATHSIRSACRSCSGKGLVPVLSLGEQYIPNFVPHKDESLPKAPLDLCRCDTCGLIQLGSSANPLLLWGSDYWYRSGINATMRAALADVVYSGTRFHEKGVWLDIGANDGTLLSRVPKDFRRIGVEPTASYQHLLSEHADEVVHGFFSASALGEQKCDVITSCAMFYDVDEPNTFVADIVKVMSDDAVWINQISNTPVMLKTLAFDNICHEHRCYYDIDSLRTLYHRHGLNIVGTQVNEVNGGSLRVMAQKNQTIRETTKGIPAVTEAQLLEFADRVQRWKVAMQDLMSLPRFTRGNTWMYGASTKGTVLTQYLGTSTVLGVADRNPVKHGLLMVGSWLPIVGEVEMRRAKPDHLIVLPWAFKDEFLEREADLRRAGTVMVWPLPEIAMTL